MATKKNLIDDVEQTYEKVEDIKKTLTPAEQALEDKRARVWKVLGHEPFGFVKLGSIRFSKPMVVLAGGFTGGLVGLVLFAPVTALMIAGCVVAAGVYWISQTLSK